MHGMNAIKFQMEVQKLCAFVHWRFM